MDKTIFHFHPINYEYLGKGEADVCQVKGDSIIPAYATKRPVPDAGEHEVAVFDPAADSWRISPDFRGEVLFSTEDGKEVTLEEIGAKPVNVTDKPRPSIEHDWDGVEWVLNPQKAWAKLQQDAQAALCKSDNVALRCWKAGVTYPAEWKTHDDSLRAIVRTPSGDATQGLPPQPDYPAGT